MLVPPILIVPNLRTIVDLGLYGTLLGVMAPYFASAFGTFLMRQTFLDLRAISRRPPRSTARSGGRSCGTCCCRWPSPA